MEKTICPWCQTEIVWDEELGPEEECPYCHNELKGYRTLTVDIGEDEDGTSRDRQLDDQDDTEVQDEEIFPWQGEDLHKLPVLHTLQKYEEGGEDLLAYEEGVEKVLDSQEEVPECPHCREYMLLTGTRTVTVDTFIPSVPAVLGKPVLEAPFTLNLYVCTGCFQVQQSLAEDDRLRLMHTLGSGRK
ncbi:hypothetical protein OIN60_01650 [Paenibacillus sp. P96]|uniref:Uncharacterized protein n=1 Tax=Paenibacillus zeirhizosphaerae TaxID=2987519 RepID=A0ABT9FL81_9BACL|nr:hypothetical protein [Paenibacillus sp. P96]MDP4095497.1 hypothetical protein [Paenibacillus sp. P96]